MANLSNINGKFVVEQTTGYVGVGTTDPNFLIEAAGANSEIALNSTSGSIYRLRSTSSDEFLITKNGVGERLTIASGGNATFSGTVETTTLRTDVINNKANSANIIYRSGTQTIVGGGSSTQKLKIEDGGDATFAGGVFAPYYQANNFINVRIDDAEVYWTNTANNDYWVWKRDASNNFILDHYNGSATSNALTFNSSQNATFAGNIYSGLNGMMEFRSSSYNNRQIGIDSQGFYVFNPNAPSGGRYDLKINDSGNATFAENVSMSTGNSTGKFAVKSSAVHGSYDFYNNGTSYFNGSVTIDAALVQTGTAASNFSGNVTFNGPSTKFITDTDSFLEILDAGTNACYIRAGASDELYIGANNNYQLRLKTNSDVVMDNGGNLGIGTGSPDGKLEIAGGTTLGLRLSNIGDSSAYDQVRITYNGYDSGHPDVTFMPLTTPGGGNVDTTFHFSNSNGLNANNNRANVNIDGILNVGSGRQSGETTLIMRNYDGSLVNTNEIQNSIRMSGRYWSGSSSQLVETRINSVHQLADGNGGSALTFMTQTGGSGVTEKMRIDRNGNVEISSGGSLYLKNTSGNNWNLLSYTNGNLFLQQDGTSNLGVFDGTSGAYTALSDVNKKKDFEDSKIGLKEVMELQPKLYRMKEDDTDINKRLGFIAQEVKEFIPQACVENEVDDVNKFIGLTEMPIIAALVKSIQELKAEIELLKNK